MNADSFSKRGMRLRLALLAITALSMPSSWADTCLEKKALYERGKNLFKAGQYLLSAVHFSEVSSSKCDIALDALFSYSLAMQELGETREALRNLEDAPASGERKQILRAFIAPELGQYLSKGAEKRLSLWRSRVSDTLFEENVKKTSDISIQLIPKLNDIKSEYFELPNRSPWLASGLSAIIPGAGQAYVGNTQSAAIAFVLNSIFLATTIELAKKKLPAAAVASGMVFSVTYIGNIVNAANSANQFNKHRRTHTDQKLKTVLFPELSP